MLWGFQQLQTSSSEAGLSSWRLRFFVPLLILPLPFLMAFRSLLAAFLILNIHELIQASLSISYNEPETLQGLDVSL